MHEPSSPLLLTAELLHQAKGGDPAALNALMTRYLPRLVRWASGRLPASARSLFDTTDLVHETLLKAIQGLDQIEERGPGSFQAYVRQAILNRIRDQLRWASRRQGSQAISDEMVDRSPTPLENAIGAELLERYEQARDQLKPAERLFVHLRLELDLGYDEIAVIMDRPSGEAARLGVRRALAKLAGILGHEH